MFRTLTAKLPQPVEAGASISVRLSKPALFVTDPDGNCYVSADRCNWKARVVAGDPIVTATYAVGLNALDNDYEIELEKEN